MSSAPNNVPYLAYKSKRHSRNLSSTVVPMPPNVTPPPISHSPFGQSRADGDITLQASSEPPAAISLPPRVEFPPQSAPSTSTHVLESSDATVVVQAPSPLIPAMSIPLLGQSTQAEASGSSETLVPTPKVESKFKQLPRKPTTFRHVPVRSANGVRGPFPSPLRPASMHSRSGSTSSNASRVLEQHPQSHVAFPTHKQAHERGRFSSIGSTLSNVDHPLPAIPIVDTSPSRALSVDSRITPRTSSLNGATNKLPTPAPTPPSISPAPSSSVSIPASTSTSRSTTPAPIAPVVPRPSAPYRPGFQPKGVYRPLTDSFISLRQSRSTANRTERTKLERRLEKLIQLHFPTDSEPEKGRRPSVRERRASSIFDLDFSDPGGLWRGVIQGQGGKADVRAAEQRITPWQDDAEASKCPLCLTSFHPLTNRKHHCRLCGKIICSLPPKRPQRPVTCSLLFAVDPRTRQIEEVGEVVDYGVRRQTPPAPNLNGKGADAGKMTEEEKFLKGVRICRECRPVLLRQQYHQEVQHVPTFVRLYEAFASLEKEIEDALPQFQDLILTLAHDEQPTKEASQARKRLLEAFAQYDALSKKIRRLPCPAGPGNSQERVQIAIMTRANLFLQKNMFPLQSLPKPKKAALSATVNAQPQTIDADSALAHVLQPLLEQEALLESFVEEAKAQRKFEDAKTLKENLREIRAEIERILRNADEGDGGGNAGMGIKGASGISRRK